MRKFLLLLLPVFLVLACKEEKPAEAIEVGPEALHGSIDRVTQIMIHDIFSPPVASRIFAYPAIAAYEITALNNHAYLSLAGQATGLEPIPKPSADQEINYQLAAMVAHMELSKQLIFSEKDMEQYRDSLYTIWEAKNEVLFNTSKTYGLQVADHISKWMGKDNYAQTRTMPKFTVRTEDETRWQPTPPAYMEGIEPHWSKIRPFLIDSAEQFKPIPPPPFSMDKKIALLQRASRGL